VILALASGQRPAFEFEEEASAHALAWEITHVHHLDQKTYARAVQAFGYTGVVDIVMLVGLHLTTCAIINAVEVSTPETATR
jgi:hypothetical protein